MRENRVRLCFVLGVSNKVREWLVKEFRLLADHVRVLARKFEEEVKKFPGAMQRVRETRGRKRQRGAGLRIKERRLREAAAAQSQNSQALLEQMHAPWGQAKQQLLKAPLSKMPPSTLPPFGVWK